MLLISLVQLHNCDRTNITCSSEKVWLKVNFSWIMPGPIAIPSYLVSLFYSIYPQWIIFYEMTQSEVTTSDSKVLPVHQVGRPVKSLPNVPQPVVKLWSRQMELQAFTRNLLGPPLCAGNHNLTLVNSSSSPNNSLQRQTFCSNPLVNSFKLWNTLMPVMLREGDLLELLLAILFCLICSKDRNLTKYSPHTTNRARGSPHSGLQIGKLGIRRRVALDFRPNIKSVVSAFVSRLQPHNTTHFVSHKLNLK